jgi:hypothetical protein
MDIIKRQAGTLAKAVLEGVMNSVDAKASACHIRLRPKRVQITDDGVGITSIDQIEKYFETFGEPHAAQEKKVYGVFRMGRGQLFAFGKNVWRTGPFQMTVDVDNKGFDYDLREGLEPEPGCRVLIELYEELLPSALDDLARTVANWVKYAPIPVFVNGKDVTKNPAAEEWTEVTEDAYVRLNSGSALSVYNLGVHCLDMGSYRYGCGGTVVTRKQLKVNFARNDIMDDCPVGRAVKALIEKHTTGELVKTKSLTDAQRRRLITLVVKGEPPPGIADKKIFGTVSGRYYSAKELVNNWWRYKNKVTQCKAGDRVGDRIQQSRAAVVITEECLTLFEEDLQGLLGVVHKLADDRGTKPIVAPFEQLSRGLRDRAEILQADELSPAETIWLEIAQSAQCYLAEPVEPGQSHADRRYMQRSIVLGDSDAYDGWTDGLSYVAVDRKFVAKLAFDVRGLTDLGILLLHELCHREPDLDPHVHDLEFFQSFHDRASEQLGEFVAAGLRRIAGAVKTVNKKLARQGLKNLDQVVRLRRELAEIVKETPDG